MERGFLKKKKIRESPLKAELTLVGSDVGD